MAGGANDAADDATALERASAKVRRHLLPFLIVCYFGAYLDRVNVGFAALTMNADLGIGPEAFGFTAGIFFLGYCLFEVPSNILLEKFGARRWIVYRQTHWVAVEFDFARHGLRRVRRLRHRGRRHLVARNAIANERTSRHRGGRDSQ